MPKIPYLEEIEEPCYFDFLYEEIRQQSEAEIINTILFESIMRTNDIKPNISSEKLLNNTLNSSTKNTTLSNPLYERVNNFKQEIIQFHQMLKILKLEEDNTISQEEMIELFFNGDSKKYYLSLEKLSNINNLLKELLQNINLDIDIDFIDNDKSQHTYNPFKACEKYGLDYLAVNNYFNSIKSIIIDEQNIYKQKLINKTSTYSNYSKYIGKLVTKYREFSYTKLHIGYKTNIYINKRPISNLLNTLEVKIPYLPNDIGTKRLKKALKQLETNLDEKDIKADTKQYLSFISKDSLNIFVMKPEIFSRTLFIYDWLEYLSQTKKHTLSNTSQKDKIEYLQETYNLKDITYKTLENNLNILRSFIRDLENIT